MEAAYGEILRMIKEEEPPKPSTRLSDSGEALASISAQRHMEPTKLSKMMRGELDWIVMKTLEKDRNRRYETAKDFAADVQRYLGDETVQACPPSAMYRLRKFARRKKGALATTGLVALALLLAVGTLGWAVRDRRAHQEEAARQELARQAKAEEQIAGALQDVEDFYKRDKLPEAMESLKRAEALLATDRVSHDLRQRVRQWRRGLEMADMLEETRFERFEPRQERFDWAGADVAYQKAFRSYGLDVEGTDPEALAERIRAAPIREQLVAGLDDWLAVRRSDPRRGEALLAVLRDADPDPWRNRLRTLFWRVDGKALESLAREKEARTQPLASALLLASALAWSNDFPLAVEVLRQAQRQHPGDFWVNYQLGNTLFRLKNPATNWGEAVGFYRAALALRPRSAPMYISLGWVLAIQDRPDEAEAAWRQSVALKPDYALAHNNLADLLYKQGRLDEAESAIRQAIRINPDYVTARCTFGEILYRRGKRAEAVAEFRDALRLRPDVEVGFACAAFLLLEGDATGYRQACAQLLQRYSRHQDGRVVYLVARVCGLGPGAVPDPVQVVRLAERAVTAEPGFAWYLHALGLAHYRAGQFDEAVRRLHQSMDEDPDWPGHVVNWLVLAMAHHRLGQAGEARQWLDKAQAWIDQNIPPTPGDSPIALPGLHGHDGLACRLLQREAEAVLKGGERKGK